MHVISSEVGAGVGVNVGGEHDTVVGSALGPIDLEMVESQLIHVNGQLYKA